MITLANAQQLVVEADAIYDTMLEEGCWDALHQSQSKCESGNFSDKDVCLCAVAECRNPSPIQDIPDYRHLLGSAKTGETRGELMRYFIAVFQQMSKTPPGFTTDPKKEIVQWHQTS